VLWRMDTSGATRDRMWMPMTDRAWQRFVDLDPPDVWRGAVLRVPGTYPYESIVDFLIVNLPGTNDFALVVATGHKAGLVRGIFPSEARATGNKVAVSKVWLIANWERWVYDGCTAEEAWFLQNYPAADSMNE